ERGRLLLMERAKADMLAPASRQLDVARDDLGQRQPGLEFLERQIRSGQSATPGLLDGSGQHVRDARSGCAAAAACPAFWIPPPMPTLDRRRPNAALALADGTVFLGVG